MKQFWWTVGIRRSNGGNCSVRVAAESPRTALLALVERWSDALLHDDIEIRIVRDTPPMEAT